MEPVKAQDLRVGRLYVTQASRVGTPLELYCPAYVYLGRTRSGYFMWLYVGLEDTVRSDGPDDRLTDGVDPGGPVCSRTVGAYLTPINVDVTRHNKRCFVPTAEGVPTSIPLRKDVIDRLCSSKDVVWGLLCNPAGLPQPTYKDM